MNELQRVKESAEGLRLSLEALNSVDRARRPPRPLSEAVKVWSDQPAKLSSELRAQMKARFAEVIKEPE